MRVQLKKISDGRPSLACVRDDGSQTWSRLHPFFPLHDVTHYAVESVLGLTQAFFGLVASGWDIDSFAAPRAAFRLPTEALVAECIVGLLDLERANGEPMEGPTFNLALAQSLAGQGLAPFREITDDELHRIRLLRDTLAAQWAQSPPGDTLELVFPAAAE